MKALEWIFRWTLRLFLLAMFLAGPAPAAEPTSATNRLNILFIAVDDLNNRLACYGDAIVKTPNIDRLAKRGVRFDRAYCNYPLCNPSRTSMLSGKRPDTTRIFDNNTAPRTYLGDVILLPEYFQKHGYFTARVGKIAHDRFAGAVKWSLDERPRPAGGGANARAQRQRQAAQDDEAPAGAVGALVWRATNNNDKDEPDGRTARRIAKIIEEHKDQPFFIAAGFHKPHLPFVAPKKYFDLYPPEKIPLPAEPPDDLDDIPRVALTHRPADLKMTDDHKRQVIAAYYAATTFMDAQLGVILDAMDRLKLWDNTIVVFFGDHGWHLGEHHGLWRKMTVFEESARAPLIVIAPGKKANVVSQRLVEFVDAYPTLTELCKLPAPEGMEGISFAPLLDDPNRPWKQAAYTQVQRGRIMGRSVRTERWRYTEWDDGRAGVELYDHDHDPKEYANLAKDPKHADTVNELKRLLREGSKSKPAATKANR